MVMQQCMKSRFVKKKQTKRQNIFIERRLMTIIMRKTIQLKSCWQK